MHFHDRRDDSFMAPRAQQPCERFRVVARPGYQKAHLFISAYSSASSFFDKLRTGEACFRPAP
jgi:hypothetical protein